MIYWLPLAALYAWVAVAIWQAGTRDRERCRLLRQPKRQFCDLWFVALLALTWPIAFPLLVLCALVCIVADHVTERDR